MWSKRSFRVALFVFGGLLLVALGSAYAYFQYSWNKKKESVEISQKVVDEWWQCVTEDISPECQQYLSMDITDAQQHDIYELMKRVRKEAEDYEFTPLDLQLSESGRTGKVDVHQFLYKAFSAGGEYDFKIIVHKEGVYAGIYRIDYYGPY